MSDPARGPVFRVKDQYAALKAVGGEQISSPASEWLKAENRIPCIHVLEGYNVEY